MANQSSINPFKKLKVTYNPDQDTLTRPVFPSRSIEAHNSLPDQPIFCQDIPLNPSHKTWLRLYKHCKPPAADTKLPLILYFHGGGFIRSHVDTIISHDFCASMAAALPAVVISVDYRLCPENRLPAAYEDALDAIKWVDGENSLKEETVNYSKCYLMGTSAGGNIAYHAGLRALDLDLKQLKIRGLILHDPFFGGLERTESEIRLMDDALPPLAVTDLMWELALPKGADRDHEFCNPMFEGSYGEKIGLLGRCFVSVNGGDLMMDKVLEFVKMLEGKGVSVKTCFQKEGYHGVEVFHPRKAPALFAALKHFMTIKEYVDYY